MATLADLLNAPTEIEHEGQTYTLRQPTLIECAQYQRWLEQEARANAAAATELPEEDRRRLLVDIQKEIGAKAFAWGGEVCVKSLQTIPGVAKLFSIICGVPERLANEIVEKRLCEIAALMVGAMEEDPSGKKLRAVASKLGLPPNFFASSSSSSPTSPTDAPPTSRPSDG